jgi:hypothetical protein
VDISFRSNRWRGIGEKINAILALQAIPDEFVPQEDKKKITREYLGFDD